MNLGERFKKARELLGENQSSIARKVGLTHTSIRKIENNKVKLHNPKYIQYLVGRGINYFYLTGESEEIEGQLLETVSRKIYEATEAESEILKTENKELKTENEDLKKQLEERVSRAEFEQLAQKLETYAEEILRVLKKES